MDAHKYVAMRDEMEKISLTPRHAAAKTLGGLVSRGAGTQAAVRAADKIELVSRGGRKSALSLLKQYAKKYPKVKTSAVNDELQKIALGPLALFAGGALARSLAGGVARKFLGKAVTRMGRKSMAGKRLGKFHKTMGRKGVQKWTRRGGTAAEVGSMAMPMGGKAKPSSVPMVQNPY